MSMQSQVPPPSANEAPKGLPPVAPPSGRFIVQLFLVPGLIVAVALLIVLGIKFLVGGTRTPEEFLKDLDNPNPDIRWRAASDLAQVLKRPESLELASDPKFGLDLAQRLETALKELHEGDKTAGKPGKKEADAEQDVMFLSACLGNMTLPVGADLLCTIARDTRGKDPKAVALRRRRAVWSLANLGDNLDRFKQLAPDQQKEIMGQLAADAKGSGSRAKRAEISLNYLKSNDKKLLKVDQALAECIEPEDGDPFLREMVAFALRYWDGDLVEETLEKLSRDQGRGAAVEVGEAD
jgi:hypothetical protein